MSHMVTRKGPVGDDKDKGQTEGPVKEMKKKMAANAEKEKQAAEKHADKDKDKSADKQSEKAEKNADKSGEKKERAEKSGEKKEKNLDKSTEKKEKADKSSDKKEKQVEKEKEKEKVEKKSEPPADKPKEDKNAKPEEVDKKRSDTPRATKHQPTARTNGVPPTAATAPAPAPVAAEARSNGDGDAGRHSDATVSSDDEMVIDHERDDMFPELAYDDSDGEFEPPTPEGLPSRSYTRRSQAKATRTPETPRPSSDKRADSTLAGAAAGADDSKDYKVIKLKDDMPSTDRKLRSSDSPKPESKKSDKSQEKRGEKEKDAAKDAEGTRTADKTSPKKKDLEAKVGEDDKSVCEIVIELEGEDGATAADTEAAGGVSVRSKPDTNYSRSKVRVSPYRRVRAPSPASPASTGSSMLANYTGNNTTMEMDLTESFAESTPAAEEGSPYLRALRGIRGRRSYKPLREMALRGVAAGSGTARGARAVPAAATAATAGPLMEQPVRPTAPVVGRKRRPEGGDIEVGIEAHEGHEAHEVRSKRARLLDKLVRPFRGAVTPVPMRRNAEIVGINTDLPLTAPVATPETFDPESLKPQPDPASASAPAPPPPAPAVLTPPSEAERDAKRCSIM